MFATPRPGISSTASCSRPSYSTKTGDDSGGVYSEHIQRYGGAATLGYQLTPHVTLGLRYQYTQKQSDLPGRDYKQNRVSLDGTYSF